MAPSAVVLAGVRVIVIAIVTKKTSNKNQRRIIWLRSCMKRINTLRAIARLIKYISTENQQA